MAARGATGLKNRTYPGLTLKQALVVPRAIHEGASGHEVKRLTLANLMGRSPGSGSFTELLLASRAFGMTTGGANSVSFELTDIGRRATSDDEQERQQGLREAVLSVEPFRVFLQTFNDKRVPATPVLKDFLVSKAGVPESRGDECARLLVENCREVGFIHVAKGGNEWVDLKGSTPATTLTVSDTGDDSEYDTPAEDDFRSEFQPIATAEHPRVATNGREHLPNSNNGTAPDQPTRTNKVFIAHGKNRNPMEQLKKILDKFGVLHAVAVDEPHAGRPISAKVASLMRECSSAIFIFTADELFLREDKDGGRQEIWRPSENVVYELGAASILYDKRIVIFKESKVTFPSDFSDLGYISFEADAIAMQITELIAELVNFDILEVRAKG